MCIYSTHIYIILLSFNRSWHMLTLHLNTYGLLVHMPQHIKSDAEITMIKAEVHVSMYVQMQNVCAESYIIVCFHLHQYIKDYHTQTCICTKMK